MAEDPSRSDERVEESWEQLDTDGAQGEADGSRGDAEEGQGGGGEAHDGAEEGQGGGGGTPSGTDQEEAVRVEYDAEPGETQFQFEGDATSEGTGAAAGESPAEAHQQTRQRQGGTRSQERQPRTQPDQGNRQPQSDLQNQQQRTQSDEETDPAVAGVLSLFVPGLGSVYNGQSGRGVVWLVGWFTWLAAGWGAGGFVFGILLGLATYGLMFVLTGLVLVAVEFLVHLVAAYDAYNQAQKIDRGVVQV
jgi:hypothetical protein